jgi:chromosome segregation ATPase
VALLGEATKKEVESVYAAAAKSHVDAATKEDHKQPEALLPQHRFMKLKSSLDLSSHRSFEDPSAAESEAATTVAAVADAPSAEESTVAPASADTPEAAAVATTESAPEEEAESSISIEDDLGALQADMDTTSDEIAQVKIEVVNQENELAELVKKQADISAQMAADTTKLNGLDAHVKYLTARIAKIKKQAQAAQLQEELNSYNLEAEEQQKRVDDLSDAKSVLEAKVASINTEVTKLETAESEHLQDEINGDAAATAAAPVVA